MARSEAQSPGVALGGGVGERQAQVREQLLEVAQRLLVDLPLERREQRGDRVDRQPGLVEVAAVELRVGELAERRDRGEEDVLDLQLPDLLRELLGRDVVSATHRLPRRDLLRVDLLQARALLEPRAAAARRRSPAGS